MGEQDRLRVYLTGSICLERGGVLVPESRFPSPQARLAFAILACGRERAIPRHELADDLWEAAPPRAWETALRAIISKLRGLLEEVDLDGDPIPSAFGCYQLRLPPDAWVDLEAADDAVHRAESALAAEDGSSAVGWALVANAIAERPFLAAEDGAFVERLRERLRQIRVRALEVRGRTLLDRGDFPLAVRDAELALQLSPFRETALRLLMLAHLGAGNPAEALRAYEGARATIADELGIDPSPITRDLYARILTETS